MTVFEQTMAYLCVGAAVTLFDIVVFNLLTRAAIKMHPLKANVISCSCAMTVGFVSHLYFVFQPLEADYAFRAIKYVLATGFSAYLVQNAVISLLLRVKQQFLTLDFLSRGSLVIPMPADALILNAIKACAVGCGMVSNFLLFKFVVYA